MDITAPLRPRKGWLLRGGVTPADRGGSLQGMTPRVDQGRAPEPQTPDRGLVERMNAGDETAFRELLARYRSTVYATAYAALLDPEAVEAIVADAFQEARRTAAAFLDSRGSVSGWLTHLTRLCIAARLPGQAAQEASTGAVKGRQAPTRRLRLLQSPS